MAKNRHGAGTGLLAPQGPMFGDQQMTALADYIQAALMLRYNKRVLG